MPFLILTRAAIIGWTTIAVLPVEIAFDAVESELKRRGVEFVSEKPGLDSRRSGADRSGNDR